MTKKFLLFLSIFVFLFNFSFSTASAAAEAQGYAVYRDGSGINPDWHSGIISSTFFYTDNSLNSTGIVIHVDPDEKDYLINNIYLDPFINNQIFFGYYIPKDFANFSSDKSNRIKDKALDTAKKLQTITTDNLVYNITNQLWYTTDKNANGKVDIDEITSMRCDGLIEYCYELNGAMIYGEDISTFKKSILYAHTAINVTPKKQATLYMQNCLGDINFDYKVTAADANLVLSYSSGTNVSLFERYALFVSDVNGDNAITAGDARLIMQYASKLIDIFPADPLEN